MRIINPHLKQYEEFINMPKSDAVEEEEKLNLIK